MPPSQDLLSKSLELPKILQQNFISDEEYRTIKISFRNFCDQKSLFKEGKKLLKEKRIKEKLLAIIKVNRLITSN